MAVLESSFLVDILRNYRSAVGLLDELERKGESLLVAAPSVMELWEGALKSKVSKKEKAKVDELLASVIVLSLDRLSAKRAAEIEVELESKGTAIQAEDVMIAGITATNGETLITNDAHYARIPGLRVLKY